MSTLAVTKATLVLLACFHHLAFGQSQCDQNACLSVVAGQQSGGPAAESVLEDCNSFFALTVTPAAVCVLLAETMIRATMLTGDCSRTQTTTTFTIPRVSLKTVVVTSTQYAIGGIRPCLQLLHPLTYKSDT